MKFIKIALIVSCVLSAVFSRRSHSKAHSKNPAAYQSKIQCSNVDICKTVCSNFRVLAKAIDCHEAQCVSEKCVCSPAATATDLAPTDKCQYADPSAVAATIVKSVNSLQPAKNKRRRRY